MLSRLAYNNPDSIGKLNIPYHYEMISDEKRVIPFKQAINKVCKGKIVLESGIGTGILSLLAAKAGAKQVYAFEIDPNVAEFARQNIAASNYQNIQLLQKSTFEVTREDIGYQPVDVVIAENLSTWCAVEPQIQVMNHINQHLVTESMICLPSLILNHIELAQSQYKFEDLVNIRTHYFQFTGIKSPEILSDKILFQKIDLRKVNPTSINHTIEIEVRKSGILNSLRLTSPLEVYQQIKFDSSDSLMPPVIVPLTEELAVCKGEQVQIQIQYETNTCWENFRCFARKPVACSDKRITDG